MYARVRDSARFSRTLVCLESFNSARRPPTIVVQPVNNMNATPNDDKLFVPNKLYNGSFGYFQSSKAFSTLSLPCVVNSYPASKYVYNILFRIDNYC